MTKRTENCETCEALRAELSCAYPAASMPEEYRKLRAENEQLQARCVDLEGGCALAAQEG